MTVDEKLERCAAYSIEWLHFCSRIDFGVANLDARAIRFMNEGFSKLIKEVIFEE